ncbi:MAG: chalcone isomerase family protein [Candidatus Binatia bacterium]
MKRSIVASVVLASLGMIGAPYADAKDIEGVRFAEVVRAGTATLRLNDVGLMRYRYVIKAYVAGLYFGDGGRPDAVLADTAKRLEIEYFYAIKADGFAKATDQGIAANVGPATVAKLRPQIDRLNTLYKDVKPGDRYALTYLPGVGTELALNGTSLGTIEGADFAAAVFAIWLGPNAIDQSLRTQLLGRS